MTYIASAEGRSSDGSISSNKGGFYYSGHLLQVLENSFDLILYRYFHDFIHAGAGEDNSSGLILSITGSYYHSEHLL